MLYRRKTPPPHDQRFSVYLKSKIFKCGSRGWSELNFYSSSAILGTRLDFCRLFIKRLAWKRRKFEEGSTSIPQKKWLAISEMRWEIANPMHLILVDFEWRPQSILAFWNYVANRLGALYVLDCNRLKLIPAKIQTEFKIR